MSGSNLIAPVSARANVRETLARLRPPRTASQPAPVRKEIRWPNVIIAPSRKKMIQWPEFVWRELKEGGILRRYLDREKATAGLRIRQTARHMQGFKQNNKSEFRLTSCVPAREYFRWLKVDPHFWEDDKNLRSLKRDQPEMQIFV